MSVSPILAAPRRIAGASVLTTLWVFMPIALGRPTALAGEADWPMYNRDVRGTRHNPAETALHPGTVGRLEEKWRFPPAGSDLQIGVVHATPAVVDGCVYFGTATDPAFYKLSPAGKLLWVYRNPARAAQHKANAENNAQNNAQNNAENNAGSEAESDAPDAGAPGSSDRRDLFLRAADGILGSALVAGGAVVFGDTGGWLYALDAASGKERWTLNTRAESFPGAHPLNLLIASPILAGERVIAAGGAIEQVVAAMPGYRGCTGRGFVLAVEPETGKLLWKFDVGPEPKPLDPPITIEDSWGKHVFHFGPATSTVWSTPSYDAETETLYFGTDVNTAPRRPTKDDPRLHTEDSCAVIALDARTGTRKWVAQLNPGDVWTNAMRAYDPAAGRYKDGSVGDTPKLYTLRVDGEPTRVLGVGCKNGGFYVLDARDGRVVAQTPIYSGPPSYPLTPPPDPRVLALPSPIGGVQTGCATDGTRIYTNGIDALLLGTQESWLGSKPPSGGRVAAISLDTQKELWRHERPKIAAIGGPAPIPVYKDVGDPVASGIAVAGGVVYFTTTASGKLLALDASSGMVLKEIDLGPVFAGPSVSRGRVYVGTGNIQFTPIPEESFFPKKYTGSVRSLGLPGEDEVSRLGG